MTKHNKNVNGEKGGLVGDVSTTSIALPPAQGLI